MARVPSQISARVAEDIDKEIQRNFDLGRDAFRKRWKALAASTLARGRHPPPLTDTHAGRNSIDVSPLPGAGVRIIIGKVYMIYHQYGDPPHLPRRAFVPVEIVPSAWAEIILFRFEERAKKVLNGD